MRRLRIRERQVPIGPQHSMLLKFTSTERDRIREAAERDGQPMRQWVRTVAVRAAETTSKTTSNILDPPMVRD